MSPDLLELTQNYFIGSTVRQISAAFQESESSVSTALRHAAPVVLSALQARTQQPGGATDIFARVYRVHRRDPLANFDGLLGEVSDPAGPTPAFDGSLPGPGPGLLRAALGPHYAPTIATISQQASLPPDTVGKLLSLAVAVELALLGRYAAEHTLDARGLASYLASQHAPVEETLATAPAEAAWGGSLATGPAATKVQAPVASRPTPTAPVAAPAPTAAIPPLPPPAAPRQPEPAPILASEPTPAATHRRWPWLLALLLAVVLAIAAAQLYFLRGNSEPGPSPTPPAPEQTGAAAAPGTTDHPEASSNHLAYIAGRTTLQLPGRPVIRVSNNSAEGRLYHFLHDPNQTVSPDKTEGWVLLDQVHFKPGTTALTPEALVQVRTLAILLKAFPRAVIKLGGYTDDQASADQNLLLSADCANAIRRLLLAHNIAPNRVSAEGYGQAPTRTALPTGPAQSRRVYVRVVKKY